VIVVRLLGGLGNQMFQYAAGRRLAAVHGAELVLDRGWFDNEGRRAAAPRTYELDRFGVPERTISLTQWKLAWLTGSSRAQRLLGRRRRRFTALREDGSFRVDRRVLDAPDDSILVGYWQSERYFEDVADAVRERFAFTSPLVGRAAEVAAAIGAAESVGVHVRRGDYVNDPHTNSFHGTLEPEYYARALDRLRERLGGELAAFVFSDDPEWAQSSLALPLETTFVDGVGDHHDELRLLSLCRHQVIANSSFSWWAAWLNANDAKRVIAPRRWFRDESIDTSDLVPPSWERL
jgi:hypothetical protein